MTARTFALFLCLVVAMSQSLPPKSPKPRTKIARIVGGIQTASSDFLYIASIQATNGFPFCGGSYIGQNWVLTAAHCTPSIASNSRIVLGTHNLDNLTNAQVMSVAEVIVHPAYNPLTEENDIALIRLTAIPNNIPPAILPFHTPPLHANETLTVAGFGDTTEGGSQSRTLLQVSVPVVSNETCSAQYFGDFYPEVMFCAGLQEGGQDSCQGDSGGPIVRGKQSPFNQLVGIVSWGTGCARPDFAGVYTRLQRFEEFVNSHLQAPVNTTPIVSNCIVTYPSYLGDGYCDTLEYNNPGCGYDGGDCCAQSCVPVHYTCGIAGYNCVDPAFSSNATTSPSPSPGRQSCSDNDQQLTCDMVASLEACDVRVDGLKLRDICPTSCGCCELDGQCVCDDNNQVRQIAAAAGFPWVKTCRDATLYTSCVELQLHFAQDVSAICPCECPPISA